MLKKSFKEVSNFNSYSCYCSNHGSPSQCRYFNTKKITQ